MKELLLMLIRGYWALIPESKRRKCLFKVSCSNYVFDKTKKDGLISGLRALKFRVDNCNSNHVIMRFEGEQILITKMNKMIKENEINESILKK